MLMTKRKACPNNNECFFRHELQRFGHLITRRNALKRRSCPAVVSRVKLNSGSRSGAAHSPVG